MAMASRSAGRGRGNGQLIAGWVCILLACSSGTFPEDAKKHGPKTLILYEHERRVAPGRTVVTTASPSGNYTIEFGAINVIANILTDGSSISSTKLGKVVGQVTFEDDLSLFLAVSFVLNTTSYVGSLTAHSVLDPSGTGELVITGGTGDFRHARGYAEILTLSTDPAGFLFKDTFYLKYY